MAGEKVIIIAGATGTGKTTLVCQLINMLGKTPYIFDINNEEKYKCYPEKCRYTGGEIDRFIAIAKGKEQTTIVYEEATIFLSNAKRADQILYTLVRKRHQFNNIIFVFHSLRQIPVTLMDMCNDLILFNTTDRTTLIKSKYKEDPDIIEMFENVQHFAQSNPFYKEKLEILKPIKTN